MLKLAPSTRIEIETDNTVHITKGQLSLRCQAHALAILNAFTSPKRFSEALEHLGKDTSGTLDWIQLVNTITNLHEIGVLVAEGETTGGGQDTAGFGSQWVHIQMLNDRVRTTNFIKAIREVVQFDDVVVDIGTGTGVLAIAAAQAGARHVYAIEATGISEAARAMIEANGMRHRISLIEGWSTRVSLPEPADVLISEVIGNDPLSEDILAVLMDARRRFLKKDARFIPNKIRILGVPVAIPEFKMSEYLFSNENVAAWNDWYGIDFRPLLPAQSEWRTSFFIKPQEISEWKTFSPPIILAEIDTGGLTQVAISKQVEASATTSGLCNGVVLFFELDLTENFRLSTSPKTADANNHWGSKVFLLPQPIALDAGNLFKLNYACSMGKSRLEILA